MSSLPDSILSSGLPLPSLGGHANWHCHLAPLLGGLVNWDCHYHHWAAPSTGTANTTTPTGTATTIIGRPRQLPLHRWASPSTGTATTVTSSLGIPANWHCHHWAAPSTGTATTITEWPRQLGPPIPPRFLGAATDRVLSITRIAGPRFLSVFLLAAGPNTSPTDNSCERSRAFRLSWCRNLLPGSSLRYCNWPTADWLSWSL